MYPIHFEPLYKDYIWGGNRIASKYGRGVLSERTAESWEISDRPDGMSVVSNGNYKGKTIHELLLSLGESLVGKNKSFHRFPLLLKIIDAKENLSLQVHPNDRNAEELGGEAKSELWYLLDQGTVYAGLKSGVKKEDLVKSIEQKRCETLLEKHDLFQGDSLYIPGGTAHAICGGTLLFEIQQNSNTTYRLYDWGREGRELHLERGLKAIRFEEPVRPIKQSQIETPHFIVSSVKVTDKLLVPSGVNTFRIFFCIEGQGELIVDGNREGLRPGMTYLVPAMSHSIEIYGQVKLLSIRLP